MPETIVKQGKILVIDDEKVNIRLLELTLVQAGYANVHSTTDSRESVVLFRSFQPDIVLLDLSMPHLDGFAVMQLLYQEMPDHSVPILVLTADATLATKHRALKEGARDFLTKPLDELEVLLRINNLLESRFSHVLLETRVQERTHDLEKRTQELEHSQLETLQRREQLRALAARATSLREQERTEIAREVHDELGQALTGLKMDLAWLDKRLAKTTDLTLVKPLHERMEAMSHYIDETIQAVRRIATQLRPALLDDIGLEAAIEWQLQEFEKRTGTVCHFKFEESDGAVAPEQATAMFRIFQEALTNVARHAQAERIEVYLYREEDSLLLVTNDNGRGITSSDLSDAKSLGLLGMRERALMAGGDVHIQGELGKGTTVTARLPLQKEQDE